MSRAEMFFNGNPEKQTRKAPTKTEDGRTWSRNEKLRDMEIHRTEDGHVDMKASYYTVSIRLPRAWEDDLKKLAWGRRMTVTELFRQLAAEEIERQRSYLSALDDFQDEFTDKRPTKKGKK